MLDDARHFRIGMWLFFRMFSWAFSENWQFVLVLLKMVL